MIIGNRLKKRDVSQNPAITVAALFRVLKVPATFKQIKKNLLSHPDFPTLLSLAEILPNWGVRSEGVMGRVEDLSDVDYPSLVQMKAGDFAVLEDVRNGNVSLVIPGKGPKKLTLQEFALTWTGVLLRTNAEEGAAEKDYQRNRRKELLEKLRTVLIFVGFPLLFILYFIYAMTMAGETASMLPLAAAKTVGFALCAVMTAASLGSENILGNFCSNGKVINCREVMNSPAGRLFGIPMSELGLLYFSGGLLVMLEAALTGRVQAMQYLLALQNILTLPYTAFSIVYQAVAVHSWCWICLVVQGIFWLEFYLLSHRQFKPPAPLEAAPILSFVFVFGIILSAWLTFRSLFIRARKTEPLEFMVNRLKRSPMYVQMQLNNAQKLDIGNFPQELIIGPEKADITITLVLNPMCGHCKKALDALDRLVKQEQGSIKGLIRFLVNEPGTNTSQSKTGAVYDYNVSQHLLGKVVLEQPEVVMSALNDWFSGERVSKRKYMKWQRRYAVDDANALKKAKALLKLQREWGKTVGIVGTPAIILNDVLLPNETQLADLEIYLMRQFQK